MNDLDLHKGGTLELDSGKTMEFISHSERVYLSVWQGNGAFIETLCYSQPQEDCVESDRIHLFIGQGNGEAEGWLMNIEDAECIINGLANAINKADELGIPRNG